jgi:PAS domain S-box-containing protein
MSARASAGHTIGEEHFRLLVETVRDYAIFMLDPAGFVASWNAGAQSIKGYTPQEIIGKHISVFYTEADRAAGRAAHLLERALAEGRVEDEGWRVRKDGSRFWADVVITPLRDPGHRLVGFAKVTRDLSARKEAEEALRQSEERLRLMVSSVHDYAIYMLDAEGRVATWNRGAEVIKGYREEEILGAHFSRFFTEMDRQAGKPAKELAAAAAVGRFEDEAWRVRKDGTRFWANVVISAVRDRSGRILGFTKVTRDLTDRRRAEEERLHLAHTQEALRLRDEFLSIASHELRTPLTALQLQLEGLKHRLSGDPKNASKVEKAWRAGERLAALIDTILDVSRIATGRLQFKHEPFDLSEAVEDVVERFQDAAERERCDLSLVRKESVFGVWDRVRVEQILTNLIANALKYAPGAPVEVGVERSGSVARVEVRDHGPGIAEDALPRIFGRFERAAPPGAGGLGVGLYVARQLAQAHGGTLDAVNVEDGGARFTLRLPTESPAGVGLR